MNLSIYCGGCQAAIPPLPTPDLSSRRSATDQLTLNRQSSPEKLHSLDPLRSKLTMHINPQSWTGASGLGRSAWLLSCSSGAVILRSHSIAIVRLTFYLSSNLYKIFVYFNFQIRNRNVLETPQYECFIPIKVVWRFVCFTEILHLSD